MKQLIDTLEQIGCPIDEAICKYSQNEVWITWRGTQEISYLLVLEEEELKWWVISKFYREGYTGKIENDLPLNAWAKIYALTHLEEWEILTK